MIKLITDVHHTIMGDSDNEWRYDCKLWLERWYKDEASSFPYRSIEIFFEPNWEEFNHKYVCASSVSRQTCFILLLCGFHGNFIFVGIEIIPRNQIILVPKHIHTIKLRNDEIHRSTFIRLKACVQFKFISHHITLDGAFALRMVMAICIIIYAVQQIFIIF